MYPLVLVFWLSFGPFSWFHTFAQLHYPLPPFLVPAQYLDSDGRFVQCEFSFLAKTFPVCSIYCPNRNPDRDLFLDDLHPRIDPSVLTVLTGDFNTVFDRSLDRRALIPVILLVRALHPSVGFLMLIVLYIFGGIFILPPLLLLGLDGMVLWPLGLISSVSPMFGCRPSNHVPSFCVLSRTTVESCLLYWFLMLFLLAQVCGKAAKGCAGSLPG